MKVFVAGATGAIGKRLIPLLVEAGHQVFGMTRSSYKSEQIRASGATPVVADALDREAVRRAVCGAAPDVIVHELTAIPDKLDIRRFDQVFATTNRLRTEGLDYLLAAAQEAGCRRIVAQSYAGWMYAREGGPVKTEEDRLDPNPPAGIRGTFEALRYLENAVTKLSGMTGIALRYGSFYGPGNTLGSGGAMVNEIRKRRIPIVGSGGGVWSFIHIDDAARATARALEAGSSGIYNIVDDEPAPVSEWLPALAKAVGAKPPLRIPAWLGRLLVGRHGVIMMTEVRGASNAKAKRELSWQPLWPTWRDGFRYGLAEDARTRSRARQSVEQQGRAYLRS
jgi:nucleoside-diphosphate-sugar epimerase